MSLGKTATLSSGNKLPTLGYGTWKSSPGQVSTGVYEALKAGYRHLDLAKIYENQKEVATGLARAYKDIPGLKREDIFITGKLWNNKHRPEDVGPALDDSLQELGLDYLDLWLIHWPIAFAAGDNLFPMNGKEIAFDDNVSIIDTWRAMTKLVEEGSPYKSKVRSIGVSNFNAQHIDAIIKATGVTPAVLQIERHPRLPHTDANGLIPYCKSKGIHVTAYSAFGNNSFNEPLLLEHPEIKKIAEKLSATPAQVILAWCQIGGNSVIPKSVTPSRIQANFQEIELPGDAIKAISAIGEKEPRRFNIPYTANDPRWDCNIFNDPSEAPATHKVIIGS